MELQPLTFSPKLSPKIWGGRRLDAYGKKLPAGAVIGESWEIFDRPDDSAVVSSGPFQGHTLNSLMKEYGPRFLGGAQYEKQPAFFPLMLKLIDASDSLSVQVHPDDDQALRMVGPEELGKTEMWLVLDAAPGSKVCAGLKAGLGRKDLEAAGRSGDFNSILNEFPVRPGDAIFLPAGRVHAIGKGCLMAEVQQNSDTTYRVWDYGRLENGKPRSLHLSQALECARFETLPDKAQPLPRGVPGGRCETLARCPYFTVERLSLDHKFKPDQGRDSFHLLMGLKGHARLGGMEIAPGTSVLVPASLDWALEPIGPAEILWSRP